MWRTRGETTNLTCCFKLENQSAPNDAAPQCSVSDANRDISGKQHWSFRLVASLRKDSFHLPKALLVTDPKRFQRFGPSGLGNGHSANDWRNATTSFTTASKMRSPFSAVAAEGVPRLPWAVIRAKRR